MNAQIKPHELVIFDYLSKRKQLPQQEKSTYRKIERGYQGEKLLESYVQQLSGDLIIIHDLWLTHHGRTFQLDLLLFYNDTIYLYEVKNFSGDFFYDNEKFFRETHVEIDDPLIQLRRSESLFRQLLADLGYQFTIKSAVVFVNPECTIYSKDKNPRLILPTQLNRYFKQFPSHTSLSPTYHTLYQQLNTLKMPHSPFLNSANYSYDQLLKGIPCTYCCHFLDQVEGKILICSACGKMESVVSAVLRNLKELMVLFPEKQITVELMKDWCDLPLSAQRMRYILKKHLKVEGNTKGAYYIL
ncbi:hypothetical protein JCM21714_3181 [Gracilibacillus boraciitolerans JCM 21714]|uniref:NERD domain-containing protein n=1 Tax=Gracilibacillus boraciitolerans JCM 21714 TaxID=1298598 RepID=W4VKY9_9BACI|nr:nuclease-related domain-containing protein [Gracilibacillus boraciitolerans]GAE94050.1 hypothetical protein JCM21714_3181 [Gracilibacillus boraciitolerans JCM 21714]